MRPHLYSIEDARQRARKRMPRMMFDFVDGAAGAETAMHLNTRALDQLRLQPRALINVESRSTVTSFLGREWAMPFGIAPMGMCNLTWPHADRMLADAAIAHNIPLCLSTASSTSIEETFTRARTNSWFQLYVGQSEERALEFVKRAENSGYRVLILTVDVPQVAPRRRDLINGFKTPVSIRPKQFLDFACHPQWSISTLMAGAPRTANFEADTGNKAFARNESRGKVDWHFLDRLRRHWPHQLIIKGVTSSLDATRIKEAGIDAVYVSNHGGRQLDSAPAAIHLLPPIRQAVGTDYPVLFDSGVRNGEAVVKALAMGADFVMLGRPFLYGIGADGARGLDTVISLLADGVSLTMAQLGLLGIADINHTALANLHCPEYHPVRTGK